MATWTQKQIAALSGERKDFYNELIAQGYRPADALNTVQGMYGKETPAAAKKTTPAVPAAVQGPTVPGRALTPNVPGVTPGVAGPTAPTTTGTGGGASGVDTGGGGTAGAGGSALPAGFIAGQLPTQFNQFFGSDPNVIGYRLVDQPDGSFKVEVAFADGRTIGYGASLRQNPDGTYAAVTSTAGAGTNVEAEYEKSLDAKEEQDTIDYIRQVSLAYGIEGLSDEMIKLVRQGYRGEALAFMLRSTKAYKDRFIGNEDRIKAGLPPLSPAEYLQAEERYSDILQRYGLKGLANRATYAKLIGGQVSADEAEDRIVNVYDRIRNADEALKAEMQRLNQLGNITAADYAEALLTGKEGANVLKRKIAQAEISTEFTQRGIGSAMGVEELQRLGVTRKEAATGAEYAKAGTRRLEDLATIYGMQRTGIQAELEQEAFKGLASQRRKQLTAQERAAFAGASGIGVGMGSTSLGTSAAGAI